MVSCKYVYHCSLHNIVLASISVGKLHFVVLFIGYQPSTKSGIVRLETKSIGKMPMCELLYIFYF